ncbi:hypothetical protein NQ176_g2793 [Zarea fungicola]|uniref:Uncharacterized protein n=1 Tax=Zarea fungicola TaxID=93591 RepID=A0ACC1NP33_9HYPO|nr:hypothetical protein NQ176_g2793 [Lecanicillium fungicola]
MNITIQTLHESDQRDWTYETRVIEGALRLIRVSDLLPSSECSAKIVLSEWSELDLTQKSDSFPKYAAISHCWSPSPEVQRLSAIANRPLAIDLGQGTTHMVSWHGLCQAAKAAQHLHCEFLWLDLVCLHQRSSRDKTLQIANMGYIYQNAEAVLVMPGGVAAVQGAEQPASWITRAWTLQEATLCQNTYALHIWPLPDPRYEYNQSASKIPMFLDVQYIHGDLGMSKLTDLIHCSSGHSIRKTNIETGEITWEPIVVRCFGDDDVIMNSLIAVRDGSTLEMRQSAAWRSIWLRTSTKPQDMVFSMMHVLGVTLDVDYSRSREDLMMELARKSRAVPSWLDIGYSMPFDSRYGLLPVLPPFNPNRAPAYQVNGELVPVDRLLYRVSYIADFYVKILTPATSTYDGDMVCAPLFEVCCNSSGKTVVSNDLGEEAECAANLVGSYTMAIGQYKPYFGYAIKWETPVAYTIRKSTLGIWEREVADLAPHVPLAFIENKKKSHVRIGGSPGASITACDCTMEPT